MEKYDRICSECGEGWHAPPDVCPMCGAVRCRVAERPAKTFPLSAALDLYCLCSLAILTLLVDRQFGTPALVAMAISAIFLMVLAGYSLETIRRYGPHDSRSTFALQIRSIMAVYFVLSLTFLALLAGLFAIGR